MVDDGSTDGSVEAIRDHMDSRYKLIVLKRNYGQTAAMSAGIDQAVGDYIVTMDADLQDSPDEIPDLYKMIMEDGYDMVSGWKKV